MNEMEKEDQKLLARYKKCKETGVLLIGLTEKDKYEIFTYSELQRLSKLIENDKL
jgi:hypothetical protein